MATSTSVTHTSTVLAEAFRSLCRQRRWRGWRRIDLRNRRRRVLLVGNYGNGNSGDDAILASLLQVAKPHVDVTVVTRRPEQVAETFGVPTVKTVSKASLRAFLRAEGIAIGGGGMFGPGMPRLVKLLPGVALAARAIGKRTAYVAIGAYEGMPALPRVLLRLSGRFSRVVTVRDEASIPTFTKGIFARRHVDLVEDPGALLTPAQPEAVDRLFASRGLPPETKPLLISLKATPNLARNDEIVAAVASALTWWQRAVSEPVVFLSMSDRGDYGLGPEYSDSAYATRLNTLLTVEHHVTILGPDLHPALAKAVIGRSLGVIAMRLHAQIFAASMRVPVLALTFEAKTESFCAQSKVESLRVEKTSSVNLIRWMQTLRRAQGSRTAGTVRARASVSSATEEP